MKHTATIKEPSPPILVSWPVAIVVVAVVYAMVAKATIHVAVLPSNISPVFPDVGIALAAVLLFGRIALFGVWLGSFSINVISFFQGTVLPGQSTVNALCVASLIGLGTIAFASSGSFLVHRFCKDEGTSYSGKNVLMLITFAAVLCCMLNPTLGVLGLSLGGFIPWDQFNSSWLTLFSGDAAGAIVVIPLIIAWYFKHSHQEKSWIMMEMAVLGVVTLLLCIFILFQQYAHFEYCLIPLSLWVAFRFGLRGALAAAAVMGMCAMIGSGQNGGPFAGNPEDDTLKLLYIFVGVAIIAFLFLTGILAERKRAGEALRLTRFSVDHASEAIMWMTPDARIVDVNNAACRTLGYSREELLQMTIADIDAGHNADNWPQHFSDLRQCGSLTRESEHRTRDGRLIPVEIVANHIQFGTEQRSCFFVRDITERKRAALYRDMRGEILEILNEPDEFRQLLQRVLTTVKAGTGVAAAGIRMQDGEDFPYCVQDGFSKEFLQAENTLVERDADGEACRDCNDKVRLGCACGLVISGRSNPASSLLTRRGSFWTHDFSALLDLPSDQDPVENPRHQCMYHGYASVALMEETDHDALLRFSVRDTGLGIAPNKIDLLFDKFSQVDASTTRQFGGTGLGLAISKHLAELMGGTIGVTSEAGHGSEFWFTARIGKQEPESPVATPAATQLHGVRVLIVDDNATNRDILTTRLAYWGMRPAETPDGASALQTLYQALDETDPFRIILIDMHMPGMDGATLGRTIQADPRLAGIRMGILTSLGACDHARDFEEIGFAAYVTKPIWHQALKSILCRVLEEPDGSAPNPQPIIMRRTAREMLNHFQDGKWRVLLAEDNITNQQVALNILRKLGLRADAVANGAETLKALETIPYDLVVMDVQMPEMDGYQASLRIRNPQSAVLNHQVPIIAMTASAMQGDRDKCLASGMDDYVSKPVTPQSLSAVLKKWLPTIPKAEAPALDVPVDTSSLLPRRSVKLFDRKGFLARLMDDEALLQTVSEGFIQDIPLQIAALKRYLEDADVPSAERQAHTIKGASANVGGERLREVAFQIEQAVRTGDLRAAAASMPELESQFAALKQAMT